MKMKNSLKLSGEMTNKKSVDDKSNMSKNDKSSEDEIFMKCRYNDMVFDDYIVSNFGEVWSFKFKEPRRLKVNVTPDGYHQVFLSNDDKKITCKLHRLVICSHQEIPENWRELQVNHIDENKSNNCLSNLDWLTSAENNNHGTRNARIAKANTNGKRSKTVYQFTKSGKFVRKWVSAAEVERQMGYNHAHISECCNGKLKTHKGYRWSHQPTLED